VADERSLAVAEEPVNWYTELATWNHTQFKFTADRSKRCSAPQLK
jgi:hypothetical protein